MKFFADTNWVTIAYFQEKFPQNSGIIRKFVGRHDYPWIISQPVLVECGNVFRSTAREINPPQWLKLQKEIGETILLSSDSWEAIVAKADDLFRRFSFRASLGTMDMLILASAIKAEATHFLSFDSNSNLRALASVLKLKVFPDLTAADRRRTAALR